MFIYCRKVPKKKWTLTKEGTDRASFKMSTSHSSYELKLESYRGKDLTANEMLLQQFFESRDEEHRKKLDKKMRKGSQRVDDFFQVRGFTFGFFGTELKSLYRSRAGRPL